MGKKTNGPALSAKQEFSPFNQHTDSFKMITAKQRTRPISWRGAPEPIQSGLYSSHGGELDLTLVDLGRRSSRTIPASVTRTGRPFGELQAQ
ncbi:hypothetical protein Ancab_039380 [Ancistrocladus abbreviatus]